MFRSEFEKNLYHQRQEKIEQIAALGQDSYSNQFEPESTVAELLSIGELLSLSDLEESPQEVSVAGRLMVNRVQGKSGFGKIQQNNQRIQLYFRKDTMCENEFAMYKLLDLGDHIGITGILMRTHAGELSVRVQKLFVLAKALLPLPDKFNGLENTELRYRERYLDLFVNSDSRKIFDKRIAIIKSLRDILIEDGYSEVETPMLHTVASGASAKPFITHHNALDLDLKLRIAPELYLKRLIVGGFDRIFEINRNFRNEGISTRHNPEFTMLEFYQTYATYKTLMEKTPLLVSEVAERVNGSTIVHFNGVEINLSPEKWNKFSMIEAIQNFWPAGISPCPNLENLDESVTEAVTILKEAEINIQITDLDSPGKIVAEIFEVLSDSHLIQPTIIYDYPKDVSPLSRLKLDNPKWAERFEFYIGGMEIGNAFSELNDPEDQRHRFSDQLQEKGMDVDSSIDIDYLRALSYGLPPTAGEGIGIDRLVMILTGSTTIRDVILFPLLKPEL